MTGRRQKESEGYCRTQSFHTQWGEGGGNEISFFAAWACRWPSSAGVAKTLWLHLSHPHNIVYISLDNSPFHLHSLLPHVPHRKSSPAFTAPSRITPKSLRLCRFCLLKSWSVVVLVLSLSSFTGFSNIHISDFWFLIGDLNTFVFLCIYR